MSRNDVSPTVSEVQPDITRAASSGLVFLRTLATQLGNFWSARRQRSRELSDLYSMSDHELLDMRLSRGDLMAIAKGTYRRE
jgi:uncharacterized protein YjiS (DUF1127 family)